MRREWMKDYVETDGADGRKGYIYIGKRYELTDDGRRVYLRRVMPLILIAVVDLAALGLMDAPGSRVMYVAVPWAALTLAAALALFDLVCVLTARRALTARAYYASALRLGRTLALAGVLSALLAAADLIFMALGGFAAEEYRFFATTLLLFATFLVLHRAEKRALWREIPPESPGKPG